ncbi:anther-specific protein BCP1 [Gastrolobium bilobum]|uniref:anther-specific protein BCP1 n=1 Tax=Gastrolobium bilobum TaxID=150636 RepID=UPI002AB1BA57|nr:anther-specific protein BCP1 [Gastrolobium bilobum]
MARARHVVVLALVMFAIIGLACATEAPKPSADDYEDDDNEYLTGTRSGDAPSPDGVIAAPIGGPVPPGAFDTPPSTPSAASSSLQHVSAVAGAATATLAGFFYF